MMKKQTWKNYAFWIILSELTGAISGWLSRDGMEIFKAAVKKPPLSPPSAAFPIVWGILYLLMGIAAARISLLDNSGKRNRALLVFLAQLAMNFLWSLIFFNAQAFAFAFVWLLLLLLLASLTAVRFYRLDSTAGILLLPYILWLVFAAYLNLGVWYLNI